MSFYMPLSQKKDACLLEKYGDESRGEEDLMAYDSPKKPSSQKLFTISLHVGFAICYTLGITFFLARHNTHGRGLIYNPARHVMSYEVRGPIQGSASEYHDDPLFGDPSIELDQLWLKRLKYATIRLTGEEFEHYNQSGILLGDGSGYLATPTAYHDLHCLVCSDISRAAVRSDINQRFLHHTLYPGYYFLNDSEEKQAGRGAHARHCLHNLYHSVTCNADMTIRVMRWLPNTILPSPVDHEHECVSWESIENWAGERYVDTGIPGLLVHPTMGEVFPSE